jgi:hypothetical protein
MYRINYPAKKLYHVLDFFAIFSKNGICIIIEPKIIPVGWVILD